MGHACTAHTDPFEFKVLMIGLSGAGKTQILYYLLRHQTVIVEPTATYNVEVITIDDTRLQVTDLSGSGVNSAWQQKVTNYDGVVFVVDSTDKGALETAKLRLETAVHHDMDRPLLVYCNAKDSSKANRLSQSYRTDQEPGSSEGFDKGQFVSVIKGVSHKPPVTSTEKIAKALDINHLQLTDKVKLVACCAISGQGLQEGMQWLVTKMKHQ